MYKNGIIIVNIALTTLFLTGCTVIKEYEWKEYNISDRIPDNSILQIKSPVAVVNLQDDKEMREMVLTGKVSWQGSEYQVTQAVVDQLSKELTRNNVVVNSDSPKRLAIKVDIPNITSGMWKRRSDIKIYVTTGEGKRHTLEASSGTAGSVFQAVDGSIANGVVEILNDPEILAYLRK